MITFYRYIEENPVRAGMLESNQDYCWSSYQHNVLGIENELITSYPLYIAMAQVKEGWLVAYMQLFEDRLHVNTIDLFNDQQL